MLSQNAKDNLLAGLILIGGLGAFVGGIWLWGNWDRLTATPLSPEQIERRRARQTDAWINHCTNQLVTFKEAREHMRKIGYCVVAVGHIHSNCRIDHCTDEKGRELNDCREQEGVQDEVACIVDLRKLSTTKPRTGCVVAEYNLRSGNLALAVEDDESSPVLSQRHEAQLREWRRKKRANGQSLRIDEDCSPERAQLLLEASQKNRIGGGPFQNRDGWGNTFLLAVDLNFENETYFDIWERNLKPSHDQFEVAWKKAPFSPIAPLSQ